MKVGRQASQGWNPRWIPPSCFQGGRATGTNAAPASRLATVYTRVNPTASKFQKHLKARDWPNRTVMDFEIDLPYSREPVQRPEAAASQTSRERCEANTLSFLPRWDQPRSRWALSSRSCWDRQYSLCSPASVVPATALEESGYMWVQPLSPPARRGRKLPVPASCQEGHVSSLGTLPALVLLGTHRAVTSSAWLST